MWFKIKIFFRSIKLFFQKISHGYSDREIWNLDHSGARWFLPRLRRLKEIQCGHPGNLTESEWDEILNKIIEAFEILVKEDFLWGLDSVNAEKVKKGLKLFGEYYTSLWD